MATDSTASFSAMLPPEEQCSGKDEHLQSGRSCGPPFQEASAGRSPLRRCHQHRPQGSGKTHEGLSQQAGCTRGPGPSCTHWRTSEMRRLKNKMYGFVTPEAITARHIHTHRSQRVFVPANCRGTSQDRLDAPIKLASEDRTERSEVGHDTQVVRVWLPAATP
ncbi:uncharacterized protein LOC144010212 isoform X2 [Festucalex cinctus]